MTLSRTLKALSFSLLGATLVLSGCNDDDGGGAPPVSGVTFDGSGGEVLGTYVAEVTASTGFYAAASAENTAPGNNSTRTGKIAPVGYTQHLELYRSYGSLWVYQSMGFGNDFKLAANTTTGTYDGSYTWNGFDALSTAKVTEDWTVSFSGTTATITISGTTDEVTPQTGTVTLVLRPVAGDGDRLDMLYYGRNTAATDSRMVDGTTDLELWDWGPGTYAYWAPDAANQWNDYFYFDALYRSGNTLKGGGWLDSNNYADDDQDLFATVTIALNDAGQPSAATGTVQDFDNFDDFGNQDTEPSSFTVSSTVFKSEDHYDSLFARLPSYDLTVDSVTASGVLEGVFGAATTVNASMFDVEYGYVQLDGVNFYGGFVSGTQTKVAIWDARYYDYYNNYPSYDVDNDDATLDRLVLTVNYDDSSLPAIATDGTLALQQYDATGVMTNTESMTFTLDNPAPLFLNGSQHYWLPVNVPVADVGVQALNAASCAISSGTLPTGLSLNTSTGAITGTPTVSGGWTYVYFDVTSAGGKTVNSYLAFYFY